MLNSHRPPRPSRVPGCERRHTPRANPVTVTGPVGRLPDRAVTLRDRVASALPPVLFNPLYRWREQRRLDAAAPAQASTGSLRRLAAAELAGVFRHAAATADWDRVSAEVAALGITARAGGVNPGDRRALYYLVRALAPRTVLEVGTHVGASTVHITAALRDNARAGGGAGSLTTVDISDVNDPATQPWLRYGSTLAPRAMVERLGGVAVTFRVEPALAHLAAPGPAYDLIFLDGDHNAVPVYHELAAALRRLAPGGVILLHDFFPGARPIWAGAKVIPGPWLAAERLRRELGGFAVLPLGELPWPTRDGTCITNLALVAAA